MYRLIAIAALGVLALSIASPGYADDGAKRAQLQIPDSGYREEPFPGIKALYPGEGMHLSVTGSADIMHRFYTVTVSCGFLGLGRCDEDREDANWRTPATHGIQLRVTPPGGGAVPFESPQSAKFGGADLMSGRWVQLMPDKYGEGGLQYHYRVDFDNDDARRISSYTKPWTFGMRIAPFGVSPTKCAGQRYGECSMGHYDVELVVDADRRISFLETLLGSGPLSPSDLASADLIDSTTSASPRAVELAEAVASHAQRYYRGAAGFQPVAIPILQRAALLAPNSGTVNGLLIDALISNGKIAEAEEKAGENLKDTAKAYSDAARPRDPPAVLNYDRSLGNDSRLKETASLGEIPADLQLSASSQLKRLNILDEALKHDKWSDQYQQRYAEASIVLSRTQSMFRTRQSLERASQHLDDAARIMSHKDAGELVGSDPDGRIYASAAYPRDVSTKEAYAAFVALTPAEAGNPVGVTALKADPTALSAAYFVLAARDNATTATSVDQVQFWSPTAPDAPSFGGYIQQDDGACRRDASVLTDTRWELRARSLLAAGAADQITVPNVVPITFKNSLALWDPVTGACTPLERNIDSRSKVAYDVFSSYSAGQKFTDWSPDLQAPLKVPGWIALEVTPADAQVQRLANKPATKGTDKDPPAPKATSYRMVIRTDAQSWNASDASEANLVYSAPDAPLALGFALNSDATWLDTGRPVAVLLEGTVSKAGNPGWTDPMLPFLNPPQQWEQKKDVSHSYELSATALWQLTESATSLCAIPLRFNASFHQSGTQIWDSQKKEASNPKITPGTYTESGTIVSGKSTSLASPCHCTVPYSKNDRVRMLPAQADASHGVVVVESGTAASRTIVLREIVDVSDHSGNTTCPEVPVPVADGAPADFATEFPTVTSAALTERLFGGGAWNPTGIVLDEIRSSSTHQAVAVRYPLKPVAAVAEKSKVYLPATPLAIGEDETTPLAMPLRQLFVDKLEQRAYIPAHSVNALLGLAVRTHEWSTKGPLRCMVKRAPVVLPNVLSAVAWVRTPDGRDVPDLVRGGDLAVVFEGSPPPAPPTATPTQTAAPEPAKISCDAFDTAENAWRRFVTELGCAEEGSDCDAYGLQGTADADSDAVAIVRRELATGLVRKWAVVGMRLDQGCQSDAGTGARFACIRIQKLRVVDAPGDTYTATLPVSDKVRWTSQLVFSNMRSGVPPVAGEQGSADKAFDVSGNSYTLKSLTTGTPFKIALKAADPLYVTMLGIRTQSEGNPVVAYWSRGELRTTTDQGPRTMVAWGQQRLQTWFPIAPLADGVRPALVVVDGNGSTAPRIDLLGAPLAGGDSKDAWTVVRSIGKQLYSGTAFPADAWGASRFARSPVIAISSSANAVGVAGPRCVVLAQRDGGQDFAWARDFAPGTLAGISPVPPTSTAILSRCGAQAKPAKDKSKDKQSGNDKPNDKPADPHLTCAATDFARAYQQTKANGPGGVIGIQSVAALATARSADQGAYYPQDPTTLLHRWQLQSKQNQFAESLRTRSDASAQGRFCDKIQP